ncbi:MAG: PH domain-containing protein [Egicoccus sp.]
MPSEPEATPGGHTAGSGRWREPRRLHPASVLLGIPIRQLVQAVAFPVVATLGAGRLFSVAVLGTLAVLGLGFRVLAWQRHTFSFDGEVLRVEEGVLSRSARSLDVARVQQVEIDRGPVQRMLGLAALRVETAGSSSEVEVDLRVIEFDEAVALRDAVREGKARKVSGAATAAQEPAGLDASEGSEPEVLLAVPLRDVVVAAVTGARLLFFPAVIAGGLQFVGEMSGQFTDDLIERAEDVVIGGADAMPGGAGVTLWRGILLGLGVIVLAIVAAIVVGILQDANFRITRVGDDLHVSRGLLSTRESVVPLRRVQLVEIRRNWLRRLLGYATVRLDSAGGSGDGDRRVTVPLLADAAVDDLVAATLPGVDGVPALRSHPRAALRRAVVRWAGPWLTLAVLVALTRWIVAAWFDLPLWIPLAILALVPVAGLLGAVEYRNLAHALTERVVVSRRGALSIRTGLAPVVKVQAASREANPFQRRLDLVTVAAHVAGPGGDLVVLDAGADDGADLHAALVVHAADPYPVASAGSQPEPA